MVKKVEAGKEQEIRQMIEQRAEARRERAGLAGNDDAAGGQRVTLAAEGSPVADGFEVVLISAGPTRYGEFTRDVLASSVAAWEGAHCFVDHNRVAPTRSVRDLAGIFHGVRWHGHPRR